MLRINLRIVCLLVGLSAALCARTTAAASAPGDEQPIIGERLSLNARPAAAMGRLFALSKDPTITLGGGNGSADDPTQFGGSLRVLTTTGDRFDSTYNLPPAGWQTIGAPGQNKGYQFTSKTGSINRVTVVPGRRIRVEGAFTATLSTNPGPVERVLRTGGTHSCLAFGDKAKFQASKRFTATTSPAPASCPAPVDWSSYGFDLTQTRFNPEEGLINAATVSQLDVQWFFSTGSGMAFVSATPSVVGGVVYVGAWNGTMYALDAFSGQPLWTFNINDPHAEDRGGFPGIQSSAAVVDGVVYFGAACTTDAECSGSSCVPFLVCRSGSGEQTQSQLCASDADCTPPASCQQPLGSGLTSSAAIDAGRGAVYVDFGDCIGAGNTGFSNSLVALDDETGALRWDLSPIPSGNLGDLDFISSPNVFTATIGTTPTPVVGVGSKNGVYYAVDQDTGALVWQQTVVAGGEAGGFSPSAGVAVGKIYAGTFTGPPYIFALDATNGAVAWQCPPTECNVFSFGPAGIAGGVYFVGDSSRQLRAFDAGTGALLRKLDLGGQISSGPAGGNDLVFVGVGTGFFSPAGGSQGVYGVGLDRRAAGARRTGVRLRAGTESEPVMEGDHL